MPKPRLLAHIDRDPRAEGRGLLLDVDHESQGPPPTNGHEGPVGDLGEMHCHGSARAERVRSDVFWGEAKSSRSHLNALRSDEGNDVGCADRAEAMIGGIITDGGGGIKPLVAQAEEDVDA